MIKYVFIGGMGRSGTSLLRSMLDSHPQIASGPEFDLLPEIARLYRLFQEKREAGRIDDYLTSQEIIRLFRGLIQGALSGYARRKGKTILAEKSPINIQCFDTLAEIMPEAKFIHMIRDGRDVVCSHLKVGRRYKDQGMNVQSVELVSIYHAAKQWSQTVQVGMQFCARISQLHQPSPCLTIKYEDLVLYPERTLRQITDFLDVEFHPAMLEHHKHPHDVKIDNLWYTHQEFWRPISQDSIGRWRQEWELWQRLLFAAAGEETLESLGYESGPEWILDGLNGSVDALNTIMETARAQIEADLFPNVHQPA